ncbi:hypothetical protein K1719_031995 [Acacia pycnantha]|nr:hypothetical protein K1719_031995 [Acacia pycnantha]
MGESKQGYEASVHSGIGGSGQVLRKGKKGSSENVLKVINKGLEKGNGVGTNNVMGSQDFVPESNPEVYKGKEVDMFEKENLHLGELPEKTFMDTGGTKLMDGAEDQMDSMGMNMAKVHRTPVLADQLNLGGWEMLFTAVYANPSEQKRLATWDSLQELASTVVEPWLLAGDFNEIKSPLEQKGGGRVNETRCRRFNGWVQNCNLLDLEAKGPFFTWKGPKWEGLERVYKRLDRCLCNVGWIEHFDNSEVRVIPRLGSDHHPILVNLNVENKKYGPRNFRFWDDVWVDDGCKLVDKHMGVLSEGDRKAVVKDMISSEGCWDMARIGECVNEEGQRLIRAVPPPSVLGGEDHIWWRSNFVIP